MGALVGAKDGQERIDYLHRTCLHLVQREALILHQTIDLAVGFAERSTLALALPCEDIEGIHLIQKDAIHREGRAR